jgi:hypothetical protein
MALKFVVVISGARLRADRTGIPSRLILVKEIAGRNASTAERHARAWFESAHPDYFVLGLDVHTQDEYEAATAGRDEEIRPR